MQLEGLFRLEGKPGYLGHLRSIYTGCKYIDISMDNNMVYFVYNK